MDTFVYQKQKCQVPSKRATGKAERPADGKSSWWMKAISRNGKNKILSYQVHIVQYPGHSCGDGMWRWADVEDYFVGTKRKWHLWMLRITLILLLLFSANLKRKQRWNIRKNPYFYLKGA